MEVDWDFYLTFPEDTILPTNFFAESNENSVLENIITPPKSPENFFNEPEEMPIELSSQSPNIPDSFNDILYINIILIWEIALMTGYLLIHLYIITV